MGNENTPIHFDKEPKLLGAELSLLLSRQIGSAAYGARIGGNPQLAIKIGESLSKTLEKIILSESFPKLQKEFVSLEGQALFEKGTAIREIKSGPEALRETILIANKMNSFCKDDPISIARAAMGLGDARYLDEDYVGSANDLTFALSILPNADDQLYGSRTLALDLSKIKDIDAYQKVEEKVFQIINGDQPFSMELACETMEGLSKAQGNLGLSKAFETLQISRDFYNEILKREGKVHPLRAGQIVRTGLMNLKNLGAGKDLTLESEAERTIIVLRSAGYPRHIKQIEDLLRG